MNWLVCHIASGNVFFTGVALVILAAIASQQSNQFVQRMTLLAFLLGAIAIAISSTPIPYWYYGIAIVVTMLWILSGFINKRRRWTAYAVVVVWAIAAAMEIPYHVLPSLRPVSARSMTVVGDSVTAGMGDEDAGENWPKILAREHNLTVQDLSHVGDTTATALKRLQRQTITSPLIVVEIGGNDLLGSTSSREFAQDLDRLLAHVATPGRQVVMFELPLPPFNNEYGRIQRSLARKYRVQLVPKWVFLSILAPRGATLDTIHLSQAGHERMADWVWRIVGGAYEFE